MKKHINILAGFALVTLTLTVVSSMATAQVDPAASPAGGTFEQRLVQRKAERKITLDEKDQRRIVSQCVRAQTELRKVQAESRIFSSDRTEKYRNIDAKLSIITGKLKLSGADTFKLEKQHVEYNQSVSAFHALVKEYQQALDDTIVINCSSDPAGFKAFLDTTRIYYVQVGKQSVLIRDHVLNAIKPTLDEHTSALQPKTQGEN